MLMLSLQNDGAVPIRLEGVGSKEGEISMKNVYCLIALLSVLFLAGCAASGPMYSTEVGAASDKENLVVYRPYRFLSGGVYADVYIDDKKVGILKNGGYIKLDVGSGTHTLRIKNQTRTISASGNERILFRYSHGWALFGVIDFVPATLVAVDEKAAFDELKETKQST